MKIYYYIETGHKKNLDRLRRGIALIKILRANGKDVELIVNDFRAGLVAKEYGINSSVTVETIMDLDVLVQRGDSLIIDTDEDNNRLEIFQEEYNFFRVTDDINDSSKYGESVINLANSPLVDSYYLQVEENQKVDRVLFFFGDSDPKKEILKYSDFFKKFNFDLLLGSYFYLGYEDELESLFDNIYESDEYIDLITTSKTVVTCSFQSSLEAKASGAKVVYIEDVFDVEDIKNRLNQSDISEKVEFNSLTNQILSYFV